MSSAAKARSSVVEYSRFIQSVTDSVVRVATVVGNRESIVRTAPLLFLEARHHAFARSLPIIAHPASRTQSWHMSLCGGLVLEPVLAIAYRTHGDVVWQDRCVRDIYIPFLMWCEDTKDILVRNHTKMR